MDNLLLNKLQIKSGFKVAVLNAPDNFESIIGNVPGDIAVSFSASEYYDALIIFAVTKADMIKALSLTNHNITAKTICWIIYPKAKTALASDLNLMQSWDSLNLFNLAPCASAAVDGLWTALRIKPVDTQKKSGVGNTEIQQNDYGKYVDVANKIVTLPADLKAALELQPLAFNFYQQLSYSNRKEYVLWVLTAKQEKTRVDRIQKTVEKLLIGKKNPGEK